MQTSKHLENCLLLVVLHFMFRPSGKTPWERLQDQEMSIIDSFAMQWGVRHEFNGIASVVSHFASVRQALAQKCGINIS